MAKTESMLTRLVVMNKSKNAEEFKGLIRNLFDLIVKATDENEMKKYREYLMLYQIYQQKLQNIIVKKILLHLIFKLV